MRINIIDNDSCADCKYHGNVGALDTCAWSDGMYNRKRCEDYSRDLSQTIATNLLFYFLIFGLPLTCLFLILIIIGVI